MSTALFAKYAFFLVDPAGAEHPVTTDAEVEATLAKLRVKFGDDASFRIKATSIKDVALLDGPSRIAA